MLKLIKNRQCVPLAVCKKALDSSETSVVRTRADAYGYTIVLQVPKSLNRWYNQLIVRYWPTQCASSRPPTLILLRLFFLLIIWENSTCAVNCAGNFDISSQSIMHQLRWQILPFALCNCAKIKLAMYGQLGRNFAAPLRGLSSRPSTKIRTKNRQSFQGLDQSIFELQILFFVLIFWGETSASKRFSPGMCRGEVH